MERNIFHCSPDRKLCNAIVNIFFYKITDTSSLIITMNNNEQPDPCVFLYRSRQPLSRLANRYIKKNRVRYIGVYQNKCEDLLRKKKQKKNMQSITNL